MTSPLHVRLAGRHFLFFVLCCSELLLFRGNVDISSSSPSFEVTFVKAVTHTPADDTHHLILDDLTPSITSEYRRSD